MKHAKSAAAGPHPPCTSLDTMCPVHTANDREGISHSLDTIEFVIRYPDYISQLEAVVKPEHYFNSKAEAVGVVFRLFLRQINK